MNIKTKLVLGVGTLFVMIALLTTLSTLYIHSLSRDAKNILLDNYNSIDYCRKMLDALNEGMPGKDGTERFRKHLELQKATVTEIGEQELTDQLNGDYISLEQAPEDRARFRKVYKDITGIMLLNMQAIQRKSDIASQTADQAIAWIAASGTLCLLVAFTLLVNLPSNIADPIKELTNSIRQIANKNYSERIRFDKQDEFGELARSFNTMAQKLEEYSNTSLATLMIEKKRIDTLINNMKEPVLGLDEEERVVFMNDVALKIAGLKASAVLGRPVSEIAGSNDLIRNLMNTSEAATEGKPGTRSVPVKIYADNKESYFEQQTIPLKITPTGETSERFIGNVIMLQNVTAHKELDFAKTNFIATVSHELKTPIASIKLSLQLLENRKIGILNKEQQELTESIKGDTDRLLNITATLLDMAQVESGNIRINVSPSLPADIARYATAATQSAAEQKQIHVDISADREAGKVWADTEKTAWVLTNLLSNAIRYSYDHSTIKLGITGTGDYIRFSVADTGQGIDKQYLDRIFDRYFRIPGSRKHGTGLGLSISKEFIEAQGGYITVESELGAGSNFSFYLKKSV